MFVLTHDLALQVVAFASLDALRCFGLTSRGCRKVASEEESRRAVAWVDVPNLDRIHSVPYVVQKLYTDFMRHADESIWESGTPRQPISVPGMTWEESCDVDRAVIRWPTSHIVRLHCDRSALHSVDPAVNPSYELRLRWLNQEAFHSPSGKHGIGIGVAKAEGTPLVLLSYACFVNMGSGAASVSMYLVACSERNLVVHSSWRLATGSDAVYMADVGASSSSDSFVASHPRVHSGYYTIDAETAASAPPPPSVLELHMEQKTSIVAPHAALLHFGFPAASKDTSVEPLPSARCHSVLLSMQRLSRLMTSHGVAFAPPRILAPNVVRHVSCCYIDPLAPVVAAIDRPLYRRRDLFTVLTTPKGLWNVDVGYAEMAPVDHGRLWGERSKGLLSALERHWDRGLGDMWTAGMIPFSFIAATSIGLY